MSLHTTSLQTSSLARTARGYTILKRAMDATLSLIALVMLAPIMAFIAMLIKLDSPGPVLFLQKRAGKDGKPFRIIKFRTMQHDLDDACHQAFMRAYVRGQLEERDSEQTLPDRDGACQETFGRAASKNGDAGKDEVYKPFEHSQVTRVGRFLRKTSLDELPQLINVLRGEMSLVGPRPNVLYEVEEYADWHRERLAVLPGITGWAQVNGRSELDFDTIVRYDIEYIRTRNIWLDLSILVQTATSVINGRGAH